MGPSGESLRVFVVQRHFSRVRRGYDPVEVDRHLELVSHWFADSEIGDAIRAARAEIEERERELEQLELEAQQALEGARTEAEATLRGAQLRAAADVDAAARTCAEADSRLAAA